MEEERKRRARKWGGFVTRKRKSINGESRGGIYLYTNTKTNTGKEYFKGKRQWDMQRISLFRKRGRVMPA